MKKLGFIILFFSSLFCFSQEMKEIQKKTSFQIENELKNESPNVLVIETCSNKPNLCGNSAFGSLSLIKVLNGKLTNQYFYIATVCKETKYKIGKIYALQITNAPSFGVFLCNNINYTPDYNLKDNKYFIFFGNLNPF